MRYYSINITGQDGQMVTPPGFEGINLGGTYTSLVNGTTNPAAWNIELDIPVSAFGLPGEGGGFVRVWGISLQEIGQAANLYGNNIQVFGGMQPGLPLATAAFNAGESGLLVQGQIIQAFGNWINTDMTLDLIVVANAGNMTQGTPQGSPAQPLNLILNWKKGTQLSTAIQNMLQTAFPNASPAPTISISQNLTAPVDIIHQEADMTSMSSFIRRASKDILKGTYSGVSIYPVGNTFSIADSTTSSSGAVKQLQFQDLIGQPTWIDSPFIQIKTVMRADIALGSQIMLPPGVITTTTPQSQSQFRNNSVFSGAFFVQEIRHVGNFRQPSADAWVTVINAAPQPQA